MRCWWGVWRIRGKGEGREEGGVGVPYSVSFRRGFNNALQRNVLTCLMAFFVLLFPVVKCSEGIAKQCQR